MKNNVKERDRLIFGKDSEEIEWMGGCARFGYESLTEYPPLNLSKVLWLMENGFLDMEPWNWCPGATVFVNFMKKYPQVLAHGHAISSDRDDCRVTIEGLHCKGNITDEMIEDFEAINKDADELVANNDELWSWYD